MSYKYMIDEINLWVDCIDVYKLHLSVTIKQIIFSRSVV